MLSPEERAALLEEAASPQRREVLREARSRALRVVGVPDVLTFLQHACDLFAPHAALARRRPRPGGRYQL
jgi:hypothetical protein